MDDGSVSIAPRRATRQITLAHPTNPVVVGGGEEVRRGDSVAVHFVGYLANGTPVTQSPKEPFRFRLGTGRVVDGWEDGLVGMRAGGRRMLVIPAALGYGAKGSGPIPPNATLVFDVMVVERK